MTNINSDITVAVLFIAGLWNFISGQFIISTVLFASSIVHQGTVLDRNVHEITRASYKTVGWAKR